MTVRDIDDNYKALWFVFLRVSIQAFRITSEEVWKHDAHAHAHARQWVSPIVPDEMAW